MIVSASTALPHRTGDTILTRDVPTVYGRLQAQFYASKVKVTVLGNATALSSSNPRLDVNLRHLGTPAVVSTKCEKYTYTHNFRDSTYSYNSADPSIVYSDGYLGGCGSGMLLIRPSSSPSGTVFDAASAPHNQDATIVSSRAPAMVFTCTAFPVERGLRPSTCPFSVMPSGDLSDRAP